MKQLNNHSSALIGEAKFPLCNEDDSSRAQE